MSKKTIKIESTNEGSRKQDWDVSGSEVSHNINDRANRKTADTSRRTAMLGAIGVAGAASLPSEWKKPVIDALVLPAHAQMSPTIVTQSVTTTVEELLTRSASANSFCSKYETTVQAVASTALGTTDDYTGVTVDVTRYQATVCEGTDGATSLYSTDSESFTRYSSFSVAGYLTMITSPTSRTLPTFYGPTTTSYSVESTYTSQASATTSVSVTS